MRILAVEDGGFKVGLPGKRKEKALLIGVVTLKFKIQTILFTRVMVDGLDVTPKLIEMIKNKRSKPDLVFLASISYAGFNLVNLVQVYDRLRIPIIVANRKEPREDAVEDALLNHFPDWKERLKIIDDVGKPEKLTTSNGETIYGHVIGISKEEAINKLEKLTVFGKLPEPLRIAHILAHELSKC